MASMADSFNGPCMGTRTSATASRSMGRGGSTAALSSVSVAGVACGTDGAAELEYWEPREVTLIMVADMAGGSGERFQVVACLEASQWLTAIAGAGRRLNVETVESSRCVHLLELMECREWSFEEAATDNGPTGAQ